MSKKIDKGTKKGSKLKVKSDQEITENPPVKILPDYRTITIILESYEYVVPNFPSAAVITKCQYLDEELGSTDRLLITDSTILTINQQFTFTFDINSRIDLDRLISNPIIFTITQISGTAYSELNYELEQLDIELSSINSIISLYEAFTGETIEKTVEITDKTKDKKADKKIKDKLEKSNSPRETKHVKDSKRTLIENKSKQPLQEPTIFGICVLDLLPLFLGKKSFSETLPIKLTETFLDDRMVTYKMKPKLVITILLDQLFSFKTEPTMFNVIVESIYNIPSNITQEAECKICLHLPKIPIVLENGYFTEDISNSFIYWPNMQYLTKYEINNNDIIDDIQNNTNADLQILLKEDINSDNSHISKIIFNCLKRNILFRDDFFELYGHLTKYHKIALEILIQFPNKKSSSGSTKKEDKNIKDKSPKSNKSGNKSPTSQNGTETTLHYMALLDLSLFLYPGSSRVRIACPITTFHYDEALEFAGLFDSFFFPQSKLEPEVIYKSSKNTKSKIDKNKKSELKKDQKSMSNSPNPHILQPSIQIFNEASQQCFIILDIRLSKPIVKKMEIKDLHENLHELIKVNSKLPKFIIAPQLSKNYYYELINQLTNDFNKIYTQYLDEKRLCKCENQGDFLTYLRRTAIYQEYLDSLIKSANIIAQNKFKLTKNLPNLQEYENFVGEIFVFLIDEMYNTLNKVASNNFKEGSLNNTDILNDLLFYAKEATELDDHELATRYYIERICLDENNSNHWFDYAIYQLQKNDVNKAFECLHEALSRNSLHKNSLLLYAILLTDKSQYKEAENCLLLLTEIEPCWVEGWSIFYMFYEKTLNNSGMEFTHKMALKYLNDSRNFLDYFSITNDLIWIKSIIPNNFFFRTAVLLLKFRMFKWVEEALSYKYNLNEGIRNYLLAVVCYYTKRYDYALEYLKEAQSLQGPHFAFTSLKAHCYFVKKDLNASKIEYYRLLKSRNQLENMHLNYINASKVAEMLGNDQEARKLLMNACKISPTPTSWFTCGKLYFQQEDYLSAEECFSEANLLDNSMPEIWAYLTLINLKLCNYSEAELCVIQTFKNRLKDVGLLTKITKLIGDLKKSQEKQLTS